jgi:hypothetical protein
MKRILLTLTLTLALIALSGGPASAHYKSIYYPSGTTHNNAWVLEGHKIAYVQDNWCNGSNHRARIETKFSPAGSGATTDFNGCSQGAQIYDWSDTKYTIISFRVCEENTGCGPWTTP